MASSTVSRIMAALAVPSQPRPADKGTAFVSASPNEFHEIGAWMLADLLKLDGWSVRYFGSDTPAEALLEELRQAPPEILAISVTMPFNLPRVLSLVEAIRSEEAIHRTHVLVGGQAFSTSESTWQSVGADAMALDAEAGVERARHWWNERATTR